MAKHEIETWDDIDLALRDLGFIQIEIEKQEARMTKKIDAIKEEYKQLLEDKHASADAMVKQITAFAKKNREDFGGRQTRKLNFGEIKFRSGKDSLVFIREEEDIAEALLRMGKTECVKILKKVIKNALQEFSEAALKKLGIKKEAGKTTWTITPYREKIIPTDIANE